MAAGIPKNGYFYDAQFKNLALQFMAIFTGLQVQVGARKTGATTTTEDCDGNIVGVNPVIEEPRLISVPIRYASTDRVVSAILAQNTQNAPLRLPMMSAMITGIEMATDLYKGIGTEQRNTYVPLGGNIPNDIKVIRQRKSVPYRLNFDLNIYASNTDQHFQILEQILVLFDPMIQIQTSDSLFDMAKITSVILKGISMNENYPSGTDRRIIQSSLQFEVPAYLMVPATVKSDYVARIKIRLAAVPTDVSTDEEIIEYFNQQGIPYDIWTDEINLPFS